jgi:hypothetical protein
MVPLAALLAMMLKRGRQPVLPWVIAVAGMLATVAMGKLVFYWGWGVLGNLSGHAAMSVLVLGGFARFSPLTTAAGGVLVIQRLAIVALAVAICASRLWVGAHVLSEVIGGAAIGAAWAVWPLSRPLDHVRPHPWWLVPVAAIAAITYGTNLRAEEALLQAATAIRAFG